MAIKVKVRKVLAVNLRAAIEKAGLGVNKAADESGVSRSQMYDTLGGKKGASVDWIDKVAERLAVEPHDLLKPAKAKAKKRPVSKQSHRVDL